MNTPTRRRREPTPIGPVSTLAFVCELFMVALLVFAGASLGSSLVSIALAVVLPVLAVLIWARWLAPTSRHRLRDPARFVAQVVLFVAVGALVALAGKPTWGAAFAAAAIVVFGLSRRLA
jgi:hypothetical protein